MDHRRWAQVDRLFHEALALAAPVRAAYLRGAADDAAVADEVDRLLHMHDRAGEFLETADLRPSDPPVSAETAASSFRGGDQIDRFRLVRPLGAGGMGEVWLAERADRQFDQRVALKIVRLGHFSSQAMSRFVGERQTLARLEHPSITRLIDGGTTSDGRPYLVMELVEGVPIDRYCHDRKLPLGDRLRLFRSVCEAVQFAHQNLIVHRDLKPANVLVTAEGRPKLLDFGIANLLDAREESVKCLTLDYASPEQLRGAPCTTAGDVYSLGVLLGEVVAPSPSAVRPGPVTQLATANAATAARRDPPIPRTLGDLGWIIRKATRPAPENRYSTAKELTDDIDRFLQERPVRARGAALSYRTRRFVTRNVAGCILVTLAAVGLVAAAVVAVRSWGQAGRDRDIAQAANAFLEGVLGSASPFSLGLDPTVEHLLARTSERAAVELADRPEVEFRTRMTLVRAHISLWNWEQVRKEARRALVLARRLYGAESEDAATCLTFLGRAQTWARDQAAVDTQRQALEIRQSLHPPEHPAIAEALVCSAFAVWMTCRPERPAEAEALFRKGIETFRRGEAVDSHDYARSLFSFGNFLHGRNPDSAEAFDLVREAVDRFEQLDRPPDRYSTAALYMLGSLLVERGQFAAGLARLETFVAQVPEGLSVEMPLHNAQWFIGLIERANGNRERSDAAFRRALELECRARALKGGSSAAWTAAAATVRAAGDFQALIAALHAVANNLRSSVHPADEQFLERITAVTTLAADPADAPPAQRLVEQIRSTLIAGFPDAVCAPDACSVALGYLAAVDGRFQDAEAMLDSAFKVLRTQRGDFDLLAQLALSELIRLTEQRGADGKAAYLRRFVTALAAPNVD